MESLSNMILKVLKKWYEKNPHYWYGHEGMKDDLWYGFGASIPISEIKDELRKLYKSGKVEVRPTFSEDTGMLNGSGYFYNEHLNLNP